MTNRAPLKRSAKDDESIISHLLPAFGSKLLTDIGAAAIDEHKAARAALNMKTVSNRIDSFGLLPTTRR